MKVVIFNSSPRGEGATKKCLNIVIDENLGVNPNTAEPELIMEDEEGIATFQNLGKNMAYLLQKLNN